MKIDYDFLKQILTVMVDNESHFIGTDQLTDKLDLDICNKLLWDKFWGHMFILMIIFVWIVMMKIWELFENRMAVFPIVFKLFA